MVESGDQETMRRPAAEVVLVGNQSIHCWNGKQMLVWNFPDCRFFFFFIAELRALHLSLGLSLSLSLSLSVSLAFCLCTYFIRNSNRNFCRYCQACHLPLVRVCPSLLVARPVVLAPPQPRPRSTKNPPTLSSPTRGAGPAGCVRGALSPCPSAGCGVMIPSEACHVDRTWDGPSPWMKSRKCSLGCPAWDNRVASPLTGLE